MDVGDGFSHEGFNSSDKLTTVGAKLAGATVLQINQRFNNPSMELGYIGHCLNGFRYLDFVGNKNLP